MRILLAIVPAVIGAAAFPAWGWEFRCRFIERVGNINVELPGNTIDAGNGAPRNIRVQFGVFDDAESPAPAGGFVGCNIGSLAVDGSEDNSDERRNPGRLSPFTFAASPDANGNPPLPDGDPFTMLTEIDATLGTQSPVWVCVDPDGDGMYEPVRCRRRPSAVATPLSPSLRSAPILRLERLVTPSGWAATCSPLGNGASLASRCRRIAIRQISNSPGTCCTPRSRQCRAKFHVPSP